MIVLTIVYDFLVEEMIILSVDPHWCTTGVPGGDDSKISIFLVFIS